MDILFSVSLDKFNTLQLKKGGYAMVDTAAQKALLDKLDRNEPALVSGGSVANSVIAISQLGGKTAYACSLGDDQFGIFYRTEFRQMGIDLDVPPVTDGTTGSCVVIITPDADRTMNTSLGVTVLLGAQHINEETIKNSEWIYIEGYVFAQPEYGHAAIKRAIQLAKKHGTKIAITFSDAFIIEHFGAALREAVQSADLVFANETEAKAFTGIDDVPQAFNTLAQSIPNVIVTRGPKGVMVKYEGQSFSVDAFPCTPVDLTGAGDMLSGAFLYGVTTGIPAKQAAKAACYLAMKVICQVGARLKADTANYWNEVVES